MFNSGGKKLLRASTYGRGIWQFDLLASTTPDYQIAITNPILTIFPTQTATFSGKLIAVNAYASSVALSCTADTTAPPSACTPSPANVTPTGIGASFTVGAAGTVQDYRFNIHGVGADAATITHDAPVTLHVVDFALGAPSPASVSVGQGSTSGPVAFVVLDAGSFNGTVTLSCPASGMPAGVSCSFSPSASVSAPPATVTLTFTAAASTPIATTAITISANTQGAPAAKTQSVSLTVTAPVPTYSISGLLQAANGYNSAVNLTCGSGAPPTCTIVPASVTPTVAGTPFTVSLTSGVAQSYNFSINGAGTDAAHVAHTAPVTFNSLFTFSITNDLGEKTVAAGQTATYALTVTPVGANAFPSAVSFTCGNWQPSQILGWTCSAPPIPAGAVGTQTVMLSITTLNPGSTQVRPVAKRSAVPFLAWVSIVGMVTGGLTRKPASRRKRGGLLGTMLVIASIALLPSCGGGGNSGGGGGGGGGGSSIAVLVSPHTAQQFPNHQKQFSASVTGTSNTQVTWQVNGITNGNLETVGSIDPNGMYTAPQSVPTPPTVAISAVSQANVAKSDSAEITVLSPGPYTVTVTASGGGVSQKTAAELTVQ
jgi:hypothetical protein